MISAFSNADTPPRSVSAIRNTIQSLHVVGTAGSTFGLASTSLSSRESDWYDRQQNQYQLAQYILESDQGAHDPEALQILSKYRKNLLGRPPEEVWSRPGLNFHTIDEVMGAVERWMDAHIISLAKLLTAVEFLQVKYMLDPSRLLNAAFAVLPRLKGITMDSSYAKFAELELPAFGQSLSILQDLELSFMQGDTSIKLEQIEFILRNSQKLCTLQIQFTELLPEVTLPDPFHLLEARVVKLENIAFKSCDLSQTVIVTAPKLAEFSGSQHLFKLITPAPTSQMTHLTMFDALTITNLCDILSPMVSLVHVDIAVKIENYGEEEGVMVNLVQTLPSGVRHLACSRMASDDIEPSWQCGHLHTWAHSADFSALHTLELSNFHKWDVVDFQRHFTAAFHNWADPPTEEEPSAVEARRAKEKAQKEEQSAVKRIFPSLRFYTFAMSSHAGDRITTTCPFPVRPRPISLYTPPPERPSEVTIPTSPTTSARCCRCCVQ